MRFPWQALVGGVVVAAVGAAGLIRGAVPQEQAGAAPSQPIVISGAYVRAPAPPTDAAAAYFTLTNTTDQPDTLLNVASGAGETTTLHTADMKATSEKPVIPAHGRLVLSTGKGHVMIEHLIGDVKAGQTVNLVLTFARAGVLDVDAPVIALGAAPPGTSK